MVTCFALFEGSLKAGTSAAFFQAAVTARLVPLWRQVSGTCAVRLIFGAE